MTEVSHPEAECISGRLAECAFVEKTHLFKKVAKEDLVRLYAVGMLKRYQAGQRIVAEGGTDQELFLIEQGTVRVVTQGISGPVELAVLKRGAFFGEISVLTGKPRTASVEAVDQVTTISFTKDDLEPILLKYPKVRKLMQAMMNARAEDAIEKVQKQNP